MNPIERALAQADKIIAANRVLEQTSTRKRALEILEPHRKPYDADNYDPITMDTEQYLRDNPDVAEQIVREGFLG